MKIYVFVAILACSYALEKKEESSTQAAPVASDQGKGKRQTQEVVIAAPAHLVYRSPRRQKEQVAPVEEDQEDDKSASSNRALYADEYRPGQVFSLNAQELLNLQPERKAPVANGQHLQHLYANDPIPEHKQNIQQFYILEPQSSRQVSIQPSHAVIARPSSLSNGGEASVGAALSVSDTGASNAFDQELLALLGHTPAREEPRQQAYTPVPQVVTNNAPQYSQVERYITKPSKKSTKLRSKDQFIPPQLPSAPQQYLIETTNVAVQQPQLQAQPQLKSIQQPRPHQALRYVSIPNPQPTYYPIQENQGIKIVAAPNLQQQPRGQIAYRFVPQYQQPEATPKQYRIDPRPQQVRTEHPRIPASSIDRPIAYLKRYPEIEKMRSVKLVDQAATQENIGGLPPNAQIVGDHYYIRPIYRAMDQQGRYQLAQLAVGSMDNARALESTQSPHSAIYVSQNVPTKKVNPTPVVRVNHQHKEQSVKVEEPVRQQQPSYSINSQSLEEQRSHLPPPRNRKAYTPEEFAALVAAGYSVTPIPVSSVRSPPHIQYAQSRASVEPSTAPAHRRLLYSRRHQYLPLRGDDAP